MIKVMPRLRWSSAACAILLERGSQSLRGLDGHGFATVFEKGDHDNGAAIRTGFDTQEEARQGGSGGGEGEDAEVPGDGFGEAMTQLEDGNEVEEPVQRTCGPGHDALGQRGRGEDGQGGSAGAVQTVAEAGGGGLGEKAGAKLPRADEVGGPAGIGAGVGKFVLSEGEQLGVGGQLVEEVEEPADLIGEATGEITLFAHGS